MTTMPEGSIVVAPPLLDEAHDIADAIGTLSEACRVVPFASTSAARKRLSLKGVHDGRRHEIVVRPGPVGGSGEGDGMSIIHRIDGVRTSTIEDMTVRLEPDGMLKQKRTIHDHRGTVERWRNLIEEGMRTSAGTKGRTRADDALDFCARHLSACLEMDGESRDHTILLRCAAGRMPLEVRIAAVPVHMDWRFVTDDRPVLSAAFADLLSRHLPQAWSLSLESKGSVRIEPLKAGYRIVARTGTLEALRIMSDPHHAALPRTAVR